MRLFVAVALTDEVKDALVSVQNAMRAKGVRGNYTKRENLHVTLAFIGEYGDAGKVASALESVATEPFEVSLEGVGSFGSLWWAGLSESCELRALAGRVRAALEKEGIPFDKKRFTPHITLVRRPDRDTAPAVEVPAVSMTAARPTLFRSDRTERGMVYTAIG